MSMKNDFYSRGRSVSDSRVISDGNSSHADLWVFFLGKYSVGLLAEEAKIIFDIRLYIDEDYSVALSNQSICRKIPRKRATSSLVKLALL